MAGAAGIAAGGSIGRTAAPNVMLADTGPTLRDPSLTLRSKAGAMLLPSWTKRTCPALISACVNVATATPGTLTSSKCP